MIVTKKNNQSINKFLKLRRKAAGSATGFRIYKMRESIHIFLNVDSIQLSTALWGKGNTTVENIFKMRVNQKDPRGSVSLLPTLLSHCVLQISYLHKPENGNETLQYKASLKIKQNAIAHAVHDKAHD